MGTKSAIKASYIAALQERYSFYTEGSRPLELARDAADKALAGRMKLKGDCWDIALKSNGIKTSITMRELVNLPE